MASFYMHGRNHTVNWDESRVLKMIPNYFHRRLTEALTIQSSNTTSNLDKGLELNSLPARTLVSIDPRYKHFL